MKLGVHNKSAGCPYMCLVSSSGIQFSRVAQTTMTFSVCIYLLYSHLQWNIADFLYQNRAKILENLTPDISVFPDFPGVSEIPQFDRLWLGIYQRLGMKVAVHLYRYILVLTS